MRTITHVIRDIEKKTSGEYFKEYYQSKINFLQKDINELAENDKTIWEHVIEKTLPDYKPKLCQELHC